MNLSILKRILTTEDTEARRGKRGQCLLRVSVLCVVVFSFFVAALPSSAQTNDAQSGETITLEAAYDQALATDQTLRIAQLEAKKAGLLPLSALTKLGPQFSLNGNYSDSPSSTSGSTNSASDRSDSRSANFTYQQPIFDFSVISAHRLGVLSESAALLTERLTARDTLMAVAKAYYEALKQRQIVIINRVTLDLAERQTALAQTRYDVGEVSRVDVLSAQVTTENARRDLVQSSNDLAVADDALGSILNIPDTQPYRIEEPPVISNSLISLSAALDSAYMRREDYLVSALAVEQDIQRRKEIAAEYAPSVVGQFQEGWSDPSSYTKDINWNVSVNLQIPIFTGGQREIDLATAKSQIEETKLNREKLAKSIESEVKTAWLLVGTLEQTVRSLEATVKAAEQNYQDLQNQYMAGTATSLDTLTALRDLNSARTDLAKQRYDYQVALRDLERAMGVFEDGRIQKMRDH